MILTVACYWISWLFYSKSHHCLSVQFLYGTSLYSVQGIETTGINHCKAVIAEVVVDVACTSPHSLRLSSIVFLADAWGLHSNSLCFSIICEILRIVFLVDFLFVLDAVLSRASIICLIYLWIWWTETPILSWNCPLTVELCEGMWWMLHHSLTAHYDESLTSCSWKIIYVLVKD